MRTRLALGALGLAAMGVGLSILLTDPFIHRPLDVVWWLAGALVLHDGVLLPLVLATGALLRPRGALRTGLLAGAALTAVALPVMLAPGSPNPTVLPLDYPRNWLLCLAAVAVLVVLGRGFTLLRTRRRGRGEDGEG